MTLNRREAIKTGILTSTAFLTAKSKQTALGQIAILTAMMLTALPSGLLQLGSIRLLSWTI